MIMKKGFLLLLLCTVFCLQGNTQVNKLAYPSLIGWSAGWDMEGQGKPATFTLANDGTAVKIVAASADTKLTGKFQQRFTPSVGGEYVLSFKAKAEIAGQAIKIHILRADAWKNLTDEPKVTIGSTEYSDYTVNFTFDADVRDKTPAAFIAVIFVDGVSGSLWFDDIKLHEKKNVLTAYQDDFEKDLNYGRYDKTINSWELANATDNPTVTREKVKENTVLKIKQKTVKNDPWNVNMNRHWWAVKGVTYRIAFNISSSVNFDDFGVEIWKSGAPEDKIRVTERFPVTTEVKHMDFVTAATSHSEIYKINLYAGKIPTDAEAYLDNVMISPIHLYNAEVEILANNKIEASWLHSGYLAGDKMKVELVDGENVSVIKDDVEVVDGKVSIDLTSPLAIDKNYTIKLTDKVVQKTFTVYNVANSKPFVYSIPTELTIAVGEMVSYPAGSLSAATQLTLTGIWKAENLNALQLALGANKPQITVEEVSLADGEGLSCSVPFTATKISYTRNLSQTLETICLPFASATIPQGASLKEYTGNTDFTVNFVITEMMEANVPYIISGTGNTEFSAAGVVVTAVPSDISPTGAQYIYKGTFSEITEGAATGFFVRNGDGFQMASAEASILPYRAYFTGKSTDHVLGIGNPTNVSDVKNASDKMEIIPMDGAVKINASKVQLLKIYGIDGCLIHTANLVEGSNVISLNKGLYIIDKCKVVIK